MGVGLEINIGLELSIKFPSVKLEIPETIDTKEASTSGQSAAIVSSSGPVQSTRWVFTFTLTQSFFIIDFNFIPERNSWISKVLKFCGDQRVMEKVDIKLFWWDYFLLKLKHSEIFKTVISIFIDYKLFHTIFSQEKRPEDVNLGCPCVKERSQNQK